MRSREAEPRVALSTCSHKQQQPHPLTINVYQYIPSSMHNTPGPQLHKRAEYLAPCQTGRPEPAQTWATDAAVMRPLKLQLVWSHYLLTCTPSKVFVSSAISDA